MKKLSRPVQTQGYARRRSTRVKTFPYGLVALGGTFDILHLGHEILLRKAFELGETVLIGITSDKFASSLGKKHQVRPYQIRVKQLADFLKKKKWLSRAELTKINDPLGPSIVRRNLEAIIVSTETKKNAARINLLRRTDGLPVLAVHVVKLVKAEDGNPLSTSRILKGEVDRRGRRPGTSFDSKKSSA